MFSLGWLQERGRTRARPSRRRAAKALALGCLILATMLQTGCRSGGFRSGSGCGLFSNCGFPARATSKVMSPFRRLGGATFNSCGDGCGTPGCDSPIGYESGVVVSDGIPLGTPTTILPGTTTVPSTVAPLDSPTNLEAIPSAERDVAPSRNNRSSGVRTPSGYDVQRPVQNPGVDLTQSLVSKPASRNTSSVATRASDVDTGSVLDHLPPLDLPPEVAERNDGPPAAPAAVKTKAPAASTTPVTSAAPHDPLGGRAVAAEAAAPVVAVVDAVSDVDPATNGAVGVARFSVVDLKLAGGSVPSTVGLGWLAEKGYRTVLDLRDASHVDVAFMREAAARGLRYVSFPTDLAKLDRAQVDRFSAELALDAARPLYFFDETGQVPGALWYIRRVLIDKVGWDVARREAENLGLVDAEAWKLARDFVDESLGARTAPAQTTAPVAPASAPVPAPAPAPAPKQAGVLDRVLASIPSLDPHSPIAREFAPARAAFGWQPLALLLATGLTFRAAFLSRGLIPTMRGRVRASLPGPAPRSGSAPASSGE